MLIKTVQALICVHCNNVLHRELQYVTPACQPEAAADGGRGSTILSCMSRSLAKQLNVQLKNLCISISASKNYSDLNLSVSLLRQQPYYISCNTASVDMHVRYTWHVRITNEHVGPESMM
jgi:hypothetical protein